MFGESRTVDMGLFREYQQRSGGTVAGMRALGMGFSKKKVGGQRVGSKREWATEFIAAMGQSGFNQGQTTTTFGGIAQLAGRGNARSRTYKSLKAEAAGIRD